MTYYIKYVSVKNAYQSLHTKCHTLFFGIDINEVSFSFFFYFFFKYYRHT